MKAGFRDNLDTIYSDYEIGIDGVYWVDLPNDFDISKDRALLDNGNLSIISINELELLKNNKDVRIKSLQIDKNKHYSTVDFNTDLKAGLDVIDIYGELQSNRGLLLCKKYMFNDIEFVKIDYDYEFNNINEIKKQRVILYWYNNDGTINSYFKDKGWVKLSKKDSSKAVINRREAIISQLKQTIKDLLYSNANNDAELNDSIDIANSLIANVSIELDKFTKSGKSNDLISKLNTLIVDYPMLDLELAPNFTVIDYITNFLNY